MSSLVNQIKLQDGRYLGYAEYGCPDGFPILAFHGTPGSRIWFDGNDEESSQLGIRLITIDRPGYGLSDIKKERSVIDYAMDVMELSEKLRLSKYSVLGVSGGGAYALASASIDKKVYKAGLVASVFEMTERNLKGMNVPNKTAIFLARYFPWILRFSYCQQKKLLDSDSERYIKESQKHTSHMCSSDRKISSQQKTAETLVLHLKEAFRNGSDEVVRELKLLVSPWHLVWENISCTVEVWHGTNDTLSPIAGIETMIEKIPNCNTHFLKEKGHFLDEEPEIWIKILNSLKK